MDGVDLECTSAVPLLMNAFPDEKKKQDGRRWLPVHWAACSELTPESELAALILEYPLVVSHDHSRYVQTIDMESVLDDHTIYNCSGQLPIHFLCSLRHPRLTNLLTLLSKNEITAHVADGNGWLPIHWAAANCRDVDVMRVLFETFRAGMFHQNNKGQLPFHISARNMCTHIMD